MATDRRIVRSIRPIPHVVQTYGRASTVLDMPHLINMPRESYDRFLRDGLRELFEEISPITDFTGTRIKLEFGEYRLEEAKYTERECRQRDATYSAPLRVRAALTILETGEIKEQDLFLGDLPLMTEQGTFIINGAERVVVSQLVRSPGVYFTGATDPATGRRLTAAKLIPNRGAWLEFETSNKDVLSVKVDRKRKIPVSVLLRAVDMDESIPEEERGTNERILEWFKDIDTNPDHKYIEATLSKDATENRRQALEEFYRRLRPGDPPTAENARNLLESLFFRDRRYDLGRVGRYKANRQLSLVDAPTVRTLRTQDMIAIVKKMILVNNGKSSPDDIDHLGNRRVRAVGELIQNQFRVGLLRMERVVRERMTITDPEETTPSALVNIRPVVAAMKEFFGGSQLSQFMDQTNPLAELAHKRRLSALGPGGLSRDRAGFDVRDVHFSHYGRICPIETPEGPNIGLIGNLATYGRVNDFGFIETPYRPVLHEIGKRSAELVGRILAQDVPDAQGKIIGRDGQIVDATLARALAQSAEDQFAVAPFASTETTYLDAHAEEVLRIAQANTPLDVSGNILTDRVEVRHGEHPRMVAPIEVDYMDVSPRQMVSVAAALIPFLEHDDANRALMGANMQRQAVPLLRAEVPLVGTGMERQSAINSGQVLLSEEDGEVLSSSANFITVKYRSGREQQYPLLKFVRSNQGTCITQHPLVHKGQQVRRGQPLADSSSTQDGELALGQSVLVAFMSWEGLNFEDAIILSESVLRDDKFTSIHIEKYEIEARDTKLGPEEITRDIPNVGEEALRNLDENGIIYVGAEVRAGDILVGKISPKGETELTAEERLLRAIFGEKAREVKDSSLRVPSGEYGKVVDVKKFSREDVSAGELPAGVHEMVRVSVAVKRKLTEGDKMAGRHGNKGVIARILPVEDMPYLEDGTPVDIILSPLGAPSRMNIGTILETHLGWAAAALGFKAATPVFDSVNEDDISKLLDRAATVTGSGTPGEDGYRPSVYSASGKAKLFDGRTGDQFEHDVCVGYIYMLKLAHLVEDKIHARSTGPYSLITQQPLGGKAQFGGQRFGEMEVWALEAYGAAHILQELLTVKSDDIVGRVKTYEAIVKGEPIMEPGVPESFKVLVKELQSLGLNVDILNENEDPIRLVDESGMDDLPALGINLEGLEDRD